MGLAKQKVNSNDTRPFQFVSSTDVVVDPQRVSVQYLLWGLEAKSDIAVTARLPLGQARLAVQVQAELLLESLLSLWAQGQCKWAAGRRLLGGGQIRGLWATRAGWPNKTSAFQKQKKTID